MDDRYCITETDEKDIFYKMLVKAILPINEE